VAAVEAAVGRGVDVAVDVVLHERDRVRLVDAEAALEAHLLLGGGRLRLRLRLRLLLLLHGWSMVAVALTVLVDLLLLLFQQGEQLHVAVVQEGVVGEGRVAGTFLNDFSFCTIIRH